MTARRAAAVAAAGLCLAACGQPTAPAPTEAAPTPPVTATAASRPAATPPLGPTPGAAARPAPVLVIVLENREYSGVIGGGDMPYLASLVAGGVLLRSAYATTHPSLPNYLEMVTGTTAGITSDCTDCLIDVPVVTDQVEAAGLSWRAYMGGISSPCPDVPAAGRYAMRHDPFDYVRHIRDDPARCGRIVPFADLSGDLAAGRLADFSWITPDLCDDGHDCGNGHVDEYLRSTVARLLASSWYASGGTVVVTYDEGGSNEGCCQGASGGHVATLLLARRLTPGTSFDGPIDQAGLLRSIEEHFRLQPLGDAACACAGDVAGLLG